MYAVPRSDPAAGSASSSSGMRRTTRTAEDLRALAAVARGDAPADLYLEGGRVLNVYSGEVLEANVAIARGRGAYVGTRRGVGGPQSRGGPPGGGGPGGGPAGRGARSRCLRRARAGAGRRRDQQRP